MNNPPAFPTGAGITPYSPGMTLRDYMAAMVMEKCPLHNHTDAASWCYARADAMLKARGE